MGKRSPAAVEVVLPQTPAGRQELARRAAEVHADSVLDAISRLSCPAGQKLALLQAVIDDTGESRSRQ
jgi:hypothetical protein